MPCFPPVTMEASTPTTSHRRTTHYNTQLLTPQNYNNLPSSVINRESLNYYGGEENAAPRTLDLFPHKRDDQHGISLAERKSSMFCASASMDTEVTSNNQFFEFLPLRNWKGSYHLIYGMSCHVILEYIYALVKPNNNNIGCNEL